MYHCDIEVTNLVINEGIYDNCSI